MPLEQHQEKRYPQDAASVFQAGCKAIEKLEGKVVTSDPNAKKIEVRFPKTILGSVLGERTYLTFEARPDGDGAHAGRHGVNTVGRHIMRRQMTAPIGLIIAAKGR